MSDTQAETEALLPWTEQHLKSALINLIEAAKNSVRGPERGGSENAVSGIYQQIVAAWNTRAQLDKPEVAPDDEALITSLEMESAAVSECFQNGSQDEIHEATDDLKKAREALRRRFAELRATSLKYQLAFGDRDNDAHRLADRVAELEAALAACRDAGDLLYKALVDSDEEGLVEAAEPMRMWRALKTKEPTNG